MELSTVQTFKAQCCHGKYIPLFPEDHRHNIYDIAAKHKEFLIVRRANQQFRFNVNQSLRDSMHLECLKNGLYHYKIGKPLSYLSDKSYLAVQLDLHNNKVNCSDCFYCVRNISPQEYLKKDE